ncbi:MAG: hypothetical protein K2F77_06535 [Muribaculaceae bacterium]|nr:hypothetical protein [Muribaculaceae bacterium]
MAASFAVAHQVRTVVAEKVSRLPLPNASVFDRHGRFIGTGGTDGSLPQAEASDYPLTVRYMGFRERSVAQPGADTVFMEEIVMSLPEFVVASRKHRVLHMLAYVREYSTLSSYTDTVTMFREKMVDFMLPASSDMRYRGWTKPRVLTSKSYYRFTNAEGLDSVSDRCNNHFSWADWVGVMPSAVRVPARLRAAANARDTVRGRYQPSELWARRADRLMLDVDVMADTAGRRWVPSLSTFFRRDVDFEQFRIHFNYDNVVGDSVEPVDLAAYSFNIESRGRSHDVFMFHRADEPFFVSTYAEVYMLDKEFITVREAREWEKRRYGAADLAIYEPREAPDLSQPVLALIDRVNALDHDAVRLDFTPDERLAGRHVAPQHFAGRLLQLLKDATGISSARANRKWRNNWRDFRRDQSARNRANRTE